MKKTCGWYRILVDSPGGRLKKKVNLMGGQGWWSHPRCMTFLFRIFRVRVGLMIFPLTFVQKKKWNHKKWNDKNQFFSLLNALRSEIVNKYKLSETWLSFFTNVLLFEMESSRFCGSDRTCVPSSCVSELVSPLCIACWWMYATNCKLFNW